MMIKPEILTVFVSFPKCSSHGIYAGSLFVVGERDLASFILDLSSSRLPATYRLPLFSASPPRVLTTTTTQPYHLLQSVSRLLISRPMDGFVFCQGAFRHWYITSFLLLTDARLIPAKASRSSRAQHHTSWQPHVLRTALIPSQNFDSWTHA